jgi:pimeloyl-ACP methyl ester carboxylesterase
MAVTAHQTIQPQFRTVEGLSIRLAESEDRGEHALLLSPWPESLFAFEPTWARLAEHAHLVAVDLPGYGHSERRDELLSPRAMGEFVIRLVDALGLDRPHAVGPDVGTPALLFAAAADPGRFRSFVIGSAGAAYPLQLGEPLKEWVEAPDTDAYRSLDSRELIAGFLSSSITRYALPESTLEDYLSSYEGDRFVETMRFPRAYPTDLAILAELLAKIQTPVQIINGAHDPIALPVNAEYLHQRLPNSKLDLLDSGHFAWEDRAGEYAALITSWWAGGCARWPRNFAGE